MLQATAGSRCGFKLDTVGPPHLRTIVGRDLVCATVSIHLLARSAAAVFAAACASSGQPPESSMLRTSPVCAASGEEKARFTRADT